MPSSTSSAISAELPLHSNLYSFGEELANAISHGVGVILGIIGLVMMLMKGWSTLDGVQLFGVAVYGASIIILFLCSTLYHSIQIPSWKHGLKLADHLAIYLLIAGTYTPLMLITLHSVKADIILAAIWALAIGGIVFKTLFIHRFEKLSVGIYLLMGWLCLTVISELIANLSDTGFNLLLAGGLFYSVGVIFYVAKKIPFNHAIWHVFVLLGALSHFLCVYLAVI
ncbi:channel protein hemolysin III family subfamily YqfA [Shewanella sp. NFH-SH190041]|uniref:PAQR family membrane homeostasis protein TrhA n=1 Tax=Shewanella sp. NFH-SH190041 TaxID=2950245 RepID=UPI0021C42C34|nr:hemolysin III family protein [Shewanella sp. NFH-SH190041]BDM64096.1 channel protein hemolysin III family subfamily YqfA [Shewanella sp. NFH-SH190041]